MLYAQIHSIKNIKQIGDLASVPVHNEDPHRDSLISESMSTEPFETAHLSYFETNEQRDSGARPKKEDITTIRIITRIVEGDKRESLIYAPGMDYIEEFSRRKSIPRDLVRSLDLSQIASYFTFQERDSYIESPQTNPSSD